MGTTHEATEPHSTPSATEEFWDRERETRSPAERNGFILERLKHQLRRAYHAIPFYRRHWDEHNFHPDQVETLEDFTRRVPVVTKKMLVQDQRENPPFGSYAGVGRSDIARIHGSSGTSGTPTLYGISRNDWQRTQEVGRLALWSAGVRPDDIVQISFPFGLFLGGWGLLQACEALGAAAFPVGSLMATDQQIEHLLKLRVDVLVATPSYALHLARRARESGVDMTTGSLRTVIVAGEPGGSIPSVRQAISSGLGGPGVIDLGAGSSSEMQPFYANVGCRHAEGGVHLVQDENYTEVVDREDPNVPVSIGTRGGVVATHLWRESQPMIRFWVGDEATMTDEPCPCGRTYPRLPRGVVGRLDDMLLIRGTNVYPSAIDEVVRAHPTAGAEYRIIVKKVGELDEMTVELEPTPSADGAEIRQMTHDLTDQLKESLLIRTGVRVVSPGTFESQIFKSGRVVDHRTV